MTVSWFGGQPSMPNWRREDLRVCRTLARSRQVRRAWLRGPAARVHSCGLDDRALDLLIRAPRVVAGGKEGPRAIGVRDGVIAALLPVDASALAIEEFS